MRRLCLFALALMLSGCGYHVAGARFNGGKGLTVAVSTQAPSEVIEAMAYDFLEQTHSGWEDGDGAFGPLPDVAKAPTLLLRFALAVRYGLPDIF